MTERLVWRAWPCTLLLLAACGGGGGTEPTQGRPGDMYPLQVGDTWFYDGRNSSHGRWRQQRTVLAPQAASGPAAGLPVISETGSSDAPQPYAVRRTASEVWRVPFDSSSPIDRALGERLMLRLPLVAGQTWTHAEATLRSDYDSDGDGINETWRVQSQVSVLEPRPVSTAAGDFVAWPVRTQQSITIVYSGGGAPQTSYESVTDLYAQGLGLVARGTSTTPIGGVYLRSAELALAEHNIR